MADPADTSTDDRGGYPGLSAPSHPSDVDTLGKYRILQVLGKGGMGAVFLGYDPALQRKVALKVMLPKLAANPAARERFLREARAAAKVHSDFVVTIHEVGEDGGCPFIAMEHLRGKPLDAYLREKGGVAVPQAARVVREAAAGLAAAHALGLVHRDIKPANLWLEAPRGRVKILDFGLARQQQDDTQLTGVGQAVGTPAFMSPEQARGERVDHRTDLFSLGGVLYRLLAGRLPFPGASTVEVLTRLATEEPTPVRELNPAVSEQLAGLVHWLLAKDPAARPQSAAEVIAALRAADAPLVVTALPESVFAGIDEPTAADTAAGPASGLTKRPAARRTPRPLVLALLVAGVATLAAGGLIWRAARPPVQVAPPPDDPPPATKVPGAPKPVAKATPTAPTTPPLDLLARIDPVADTVAGAWERTPAGLAGRKGGDDRVPRIEVPYRPPAEYDVTAEFTRTDGYAAVTLALSRGGRPFSWTLALGSKGYGFRIIDGRDIPTQTADTQKARVRTGTRHVTRVEVRKDRLTGFLDGERIADVWTDGSSLSVGANDRLRDDALLGLVCSPGATVTFHRVEVVEVTGTGMFTRPAATRPDPTFFNGEDLTGWDGNPAVWKVETGELVGTNSGKGEYHLLTGARPARDFELTFDARCRFPDPAPDAIKAACNLFFRRDSARRDYGAVELAGWPGRPHRAVGGEWVPVPADYPAELHRAYKPDVFYAYGLRVQGRRVTVTVNGRAAFDGDYPPDLPPAGVIGWSLSPKCSELRVKNVVFRDLTPPGPALFNGTDLTGWKFDPTVWRVENGEVVGVVPDNKGHKALTLGRPVRDFELAFEAHVRPHPGAATPLASVRFRKVGEGLAEAGLDLNGRPGAVFRIGTGGKDFATLAGPPPAGPARADGYTAFALRVVGKRVTVTVNREPVVTDKEFPGLPDGSMLAWDMGSGCAELRVRNVRFTDLTPPGPDERAVTCELLTAWNAQLVLNRADGTTLRVRPGDALPAGAFAVAKVEWHENRVPAGATGAGLIRLVRDLPGLESLYDHHRLFVLTADDLAGLAGGPAGAALEHLSARINLGPGALAALARFPRLTRLYVLAPDAGDDVLTALAAARPGLTHLCLSDLGANAAVGPKGVAAVARLPLLYLALDRCRVPSAAFAGLADGLPGLINLGLFGTAGADEYLPTVARFRRLATLNLSGTNVTDGGLKHLHGHPALARLFLGGTKVTAAGVAGLQKALPKCDISWDDPAKK